jgi:hypothetical protein
MPTMTIADHRARNDRQRIRLFMPTVPNTGAAAEVPEH